MFFKNFKIDKAYKDGILDASVIGMHMVSGPAVGYGIGWVLEKYAHTGRTTTMICLALGVGAGILNVYRDMKRLKRKMYESDDERNDQQN